MKKNKYLVVVNFTPMEFTVHAKNRTEAKKIAYQKSENRKPKIDRNDTYCDDYPPHTLMSVPIK